MRRSVWLFIFVSNSAFASACPAGFTGIEMPSSIVLGPRCANGTIDLGEVVTNCDTSSLSCVPELACAIATGLHVRDTVSVPLYSVQYTERAIHIAQNDITCYANLIEGNAPGLNVLIDDTIYLATSLHKCMAVNISGTVNVAMPAENAVAWYGMVGDSSIVATSQCGETWGANGQTRNAIGVSETVSNHKYCWCRILSPVLSSWAFSATMDNGAACETTCGQSCAQNFKNNAEFRRALIDSMN